MVALKDIRQKFLDFFSERGHHVVESSSLVPDNDPTLLFTNAGMVQFKNLFTGTESREYVRAVTSQKCLRAGGKHNDLDNVGYTARHHTFFEMLGNFSFGDYFKAEAILYAWELITREFALPEDRLLVTVYHTDDEAFDLWKKIAGLDESRILRIPTSDNFWAMGDTGPCGPCSEIFYDHGPEIAGGPPGSPDENGDRFIEIWNLVFMQHEKFSDGRQEALPKPSIDTGMGLERMAAILQGKHDNYDIDIFDHLIAHSVELTGVKAQGQALFSHRVIADHLRACSFLMADGLTPSNEGRGYVLRRIMRRAMRHVHILGSKDPLMHRLVPVLIKEMGDSYLQLKRAQSLIENLFLQEESRFQKTLGRGMAHLQAAMTGLQPGDKLDGASAFKLYDTYGLPLDLIEDNLREHSIKVDVAGFNKSMEHQKALAKAAGFKSGDSGEDDIWLQLAAQFGATEFTGYETLSGESSVLAMIVQGRVVDKAVDVPVIFLTAKTPFYAESGGQAGDKGTANFASGGTMIIEDVQKRANGLHVHIGRLSGSVCIGDRVRLNVDKDNRIRTCRNHSATHIMHTALRQVLGSHVSQKGQMVDGERIRFDIAHGATISEQELAQVEAQVNAVILQNVPSLTREMSPESAIETGALALFGESYGEQVRVLFLGHALDDEAVNYSVELCGGTHVARTGDIALFKIISEGAVAAGIRRLEAVTGEAARQFLEHQVELVRRSADMLKIGVEEVPERVAALIKARKSLEKDLNQAQQKLVLLGGNGESTDIETIKGIQFVGRILADISGKALRSVLTEQIQAMGSGICVFVTREDDKVSAAVAVSPDLTAQYNAVDLVNIGAAKIGGRGGGRADMAQAGGHNVAGAAEALAAIRAAI